MTNFKVGDTVRKVKIMNRLKDISYAIALIISGLFLLYHFAMIPKAHGQERGYYTACAVLHEHGRQCLTWHSFDSLRTLEVIPIGEGTAVHADSIVFINSEKKYGWITDSIIWVQTDTTFEGDKCHAHDFVFSEPYKITNRTGDGLYLKNGLLVCIAGYHANKRLNKYPSHEEAEHCPHEVLEREKICRKCLRSVVEREQWFQRYVDPQKTEFGRLKEKQMERR